MLVVFFSFSVVISTKNNAFVAVCQTFIYSVSLSVCLSICLSVCPSVFLAIRQRAGLLKRINKSNKSTQKLWTTSDKMLESGDTRLGQGIGFSCCRGTARHHVSASTNLVNCRTAVRKIASEKRRNRWVTLKATRFHRKWRYLTGSLPI